MTTSMAVDAAGPLAGPVPQLMANPQSRTHQKLDKLINMVTAQQAEFRAMSAQMENMLQQLGIPKDRQCTTDAAVQGLHDTLTALNLDSCRGV